MQQSVEITDAVIEWLYEHSAGVISVVVSLIHDAQEITILNGKEVLNLETLNEAYQKRLSLLHDYIKPTIINKGQLSKPKKKITATSITKSGGEVSEMGNASISDMVVKAKSEDTDIVSLMREHFVVVEVAV